jgi:hypothetical protein
MYRGDYVDGNGIEVALTWWVRAESAGCALYWWWVGLGGGAPLGGGILAEPSCHYLLKVVWYVCTYVEMMK